jgi:hypothetical protein
VTAEDLLVPAAAVAVVVLLALAALLLLRRDRARTAALTTALAEARAESVELRERLDALSRRVEGSRADEYVITDIGHATAGPEGASAPPARIEGRLFADLVVRESFVRAVAIGHGVRRALAPEARNRIRFEMKREVKRSRRQRRAELREIRRAQQARQREREVA